MKSVTTHVLRRGFLRASKVLALAILSSAGVAYGQYNLLQNPGAEANSYAGWVLYNNGTPNFYIDGAPPFDGAHDFKVFGDYNAAYNTNTMTQIFAAHPGEVLTAGMESQSLSGDYIGQAGNMAWLDVTFRDANNAVLTRYRSTIIEAGFPTDTWEPTPVTNEWSADGSTLTGTDPSGNLVAPAGTASVVFAGTFYLVNYGGGSVYWDDFYLDSAIAPPLITNLAPASALIMATNRTLSFTVLDPAANVTNVQVALTATPLGGYPASSSYGPTSNGVAATGLGTTTVNFSVPLTSNTIYSAVITASDTNGFASQVSATFDTVQPVLVWEAEDYNFNSGQTTPTPFDGGVNLFADDQATEGIDDNKVNGADANGATANDHQYRPSDNPAIDIANEAGAYRAKFGPNGEFGTDYDIGYASPGDWLNYTRTFPAGSYNVYARLAEGGGGAAVTLSQVTSGATTTTQTTTNLGTFTINGNNWNQYNYVPLEDQYGVTIPVSLSGAETLRATQTGANGVNENFYFIVPAMALPNPALLGIYPTGTHPFEPTNHFTFTVNQGAGTAITASQIHLALNGTDVTSQATIASVGTNWQVSIPVALNASYTAFISVTNSEHLPAFKTIKFDTFSQSNYMWEGEDYDFNGGQFIDNPVPTADTPGAGVGTGLTSGELETNSYYCYPADISGDTALEGIDAFVGTDSGESFNYRFDTDALVGAQPTGDWLRQKFHDAQATYGDTNITDFNVGWFNPTWWLNYTRHYPAGSYHVYGRLATAAPYSGCILSEVTNGWGTADQSTNVLGTFSDPNASGYQSWDWVPLEDSQGNMVTVTFNGSTNTLKFTSVGLNVNFFMLVPVSGSPTAASLTAAVDGNQIFLSFPTQSNHTYTLQSNSAVVGGTWGTVSVVSGDGTTKTVPDTITPSGNKFYRLLEQ